MNSTNAASFTDADLAANQRGLISDDQRQQLKRQQNVFSTVIVALGVSSLIIAIVGIVIGQMVGPLFMAFMVVFAVVEFVALYTLINRFRLKIVEDIEQGRVERYEGEVQQSSVRRRRGGLTAINIGEYRIYADRATYRSLSAGEKVRAYVAPVSKTLLSYERVD